MKFNRFVFVSVLGAVMSCASHTASQPKETTPVRITNKCNTVREIPVLIDVDQWKESELACIVKALRAWSEGTGGRIKWVTVTDENLERALILEKIDSNILGFHSPHGNLISLMPSRASNEKVFTGVIIHEVGHSLGLKHNSKNVMTFMRPVMNDVPPSLLENPMLPEADIEAYWEHDKCSIFDEPWGK